MLDRHSVHSTRATHNRIGDTAGIRTRGPGSTSLARSHLGYGALLPEYLRTLLSKITGSVCVQKDKVLLTCMQEESRRRNKPKARNKLIY